MKSKWGYSEIRQVFSKAGFIRIKKKRLRADLAAPGI